MQEVCFCVRFGVTEGLLLPGGKTCTHEMSFPVWIILCYSAVYLFITIHITILRLLQSKKEVWLEKKSFFFSMLTAGEKALFLIKESNK